VIRLRPSLDAPCDPHDDHRFDLCDEGRVVGFLAGRACDGVFRVSRFEIAEEGRRLAVGEARSLLRELREHLPESVVFLCGEKTRGSGPPTERFRFLSDAVFTLLELPAPEALDLE